MKGQISVVLAKLIAQRKQLDVAIQALQNLDESEAPALPKAAKQKKPAKGRGWSEARLQKFRATRAAQAAAKAAKADGPAATSTPSQDASA